MFAQKFSSYLGYTVFWIIPVNSDRDFFVQEINDQRHANEILAEDEIDFLEIDESSEEGQEYLEAIAAESIAQLGYSLVL